MARDFFSDPETPDLRWQRRSQSHVDWLESSTMPSANNFRRFLNNCLSAIPARHAWSIRERLRHEWKQTYFELQVARFLQALDPLDIEYGPLASSEPHVDFVLTFPDGVVSIEATSKVFNKEAMEEWERRVFDLQEQDGLITGGVSFVDDTPKKIRHAVLDKWKQARAARKPVLIAVDASHMGTRRSDDFDVALYGSTVMWLGENRQPEGNYYKPDGVLSADTGPTVDGVLAFMDVQMTYAADPVLYRNPNSVEPLPEAILGLTQRTFGADGLGWQPATGEPIMANLPWGEWGDDPGEEEPPA